MKFKQVFAFCVLTVVLSTFTFAQSTYEFLRIDVSPRAAALAGSYVSNSDDPNVIFYNPAGINNLEGMPVSFSYVKYLSGLGINLAGFSMSKDFEGIGRFATGISYINYGNFEGKDEYGTDTKDFSVGEVAFLVGYGNSLDENFYYGANAKFIYSSFAEVSSSALAVDLGLQYVFPEQLINIGFSVLNIGGQLSSYFNTKEDLPLDMRIGISKRLEHLPLRLYLSFNKLNDDNGKFSDRFKTFTVGAEFNLSKVLRLRLGYDNEKRKEMKIGTTAGLAGFNIGVGAVISGYNFDYAYSSWGEIGSLNRIGISTTF